MVVWSLDIKFNVSNGLPNPENFIINTFLDCSNQQRVNYSISCFPAINFDINYGLPSLVDFKISSMGV